jgi:hypothetical protein
MKKFWGVLLVFFLPVSSRCNEFGESAEISHYSTVMCEPAATMFMQQAEAMVHVTGFRVLPNAASVLIPLFIEGPEILGMHLIGTLDRSRLTFEARLFNESGSSVGLCSLTTPPPTAPHVIELAHLTCALPPGTIQPGYWALQLRWIAGPAINRAYTIPLQLCVVPAFRMVPCSPAGSSVVGVRADPSGAPRIGMCLSSVSNQRNTLSLGHLLPFIEFYRLAGVHHMALHTRPDVFADFAETLSKMYAHEAPEFVLEIIDSNYLARDPFSVVRYQYYDQVPVLNSCLSRLAGRVDWLGFADLDEWFLPSRHEDRLGAVLPALAAEFGKVSPSFSCMQVLQQNVADAYVHTGAFSDTPYTHYRTQGKSHPTQRSSWPKLWCRPASTRAVWIHHGEGFNVGRPSEALNHLIWDVAVPPSNATFRHFRSYLSRRTDAGTSTKLPVSAALNARLRQAIANRKSAASSPQ